jgi:hypothetical protein
MEGVIVAVTFLSIPLAYVITRFYLQLQEMKLKHGAGGGNSEMRKEMGNLMAENEEIKERLRNLETLLGNEKQRIDLDYQKEQILIDKQNKMK